MVAVHAAGASTQRRIALIKPRFATDEHASHAVQLFDSVLWFFKGTTRSSWLSAEATDAAVVVVHHSEPPAQLDAWRRAGKVVIKLSTDEANHPADPRTLLYPFPAVQVLSLLERVEAEMDGSHNDAPARPPIPAVSRRSEDPWSFVEALRTLRTLGNSTIWLECERGASLWIQGDGSRYFCDSGTAAAIRAGEIDLSGLTLQKSSLPPDNLAPRDGAELLWFSAFHASTALAPWLEERTFYRLLRWPDFGRVRANDQVTRTAQIRIVTALAYAPASVATLAARTRTSVEQATRTMNALGSGALIGPAQIAQREQPPRRQGHVPDSAGGFKQFLRNLRKHLRLGVH